MIISKNSHEVNGFDSPELGEVVKCLSHIFEGNSRKFLNALGVFKRTFLTAYLTSMVNFGLKLQKVHLKSETHLKTTRNLPTQVVRTWHWTSVRVRFWKNHIEELICARCASRAHVQFWARKLLFVTPKSFDQKLWWNHEWCTCEWEWWNFWIQLRFNLLQNNSFKVLLIAATIMQRWQ